MQSNFDVIGSFVFESMKLMETKADEIDVGRFDEVEDNEFDGVVSFECDRVGRDAIDAR